MEFKPKLFNTAERLYTAIKQKQITTLASETVWLNQWVATEVAALVTPDAWSEQLTACCTHLLTTLGSLFVLLRITAASAPSPNDALARAKEELAANLNAVALLDYFQPGASFETLRDTVYADYAGRINAIGWAKELAALEPVEIEIVVRDPTFVDYKDIEAIADPTWDDGFRREVFSGIHASESLDAEYESVDILSTTGFSNMIAILFRSGHVTPVVDDFVRVADGNNDRKFGKQSSVQSIVALHTKIVEMNKLPPEEREALIQQTFDKSLLQVNGVHVNVYNELAATFDVAYKKNATADAETRQLVRRLQTISSNAFYSFDPPTKNGVSVQLTDAMPVVRSCFLRTALPIKKDPPLFQTRMGRPREVLSVIGIIVHDRPTTTYRTDLIKSASKFKLGNRPGLLLFSEQTSFRKIVQSLAKQLSAAVYNTATRALMERGPRSYTVAWRSLWDWHLFNEKASYKNLPHQYSPLYGWAALLERAVFSKQFAPPAETATPTITGLRPLHLIELAPPTAQTIICGHELAKDPLIFADNSSNSKIKTCMVCGATLDGYVFIEDVKIEQTPASESVYIEDNSLTHTRLEEEVLMNEYRHAIRKMLEHTEKFAKLSGMRQFVGDSNLYFRENVMRWTVMLMEDCAAHMLLNKTQAPSASVLRPVEPTVILQSFSNRNDVDFALKSDVLVAYLSVVILINVDPNLLTEQKTINRADFESFRQSTTYKAACAVPGILLSGNERLAYAVYYVCKTMIKYKIWTGGASSVLTLLHSMLHALGMILEISADSTVLKILRRLLQQNYFEDTTLMKSVEVAVKAVKVIDITASRSVVRAGQYRPASDDTWMHVKRRMPPPKPTTWFYPNTADYICTNGAFHKFTIGLEVKCEVCGQPLGSNANVTRDSERKRQVLVVLARLICTKSPNYKHAPFEGKCKHCGMPDYPSDEDVRKHMDVKAVTAVIKEERDTHEQLVESAIKRNKTAAAEKIAMLKLAPPKEHWAKVAHELEILIVDEGIHIRNNATKYVYDAGDVADGKVLEGHPTFKQAVISVYQGGRKKTMFFGRYSLWQVGYTNEENVAVVDIVQSTVVTRQYSLIEKLRLLGSPYEFTSNPASVRVLYQRRLRSILRQINVALVQYRGNDVKTPTWMQQHRQSLETVNWGTPPVFSEWSLAYDTIVHNYGLAQEEGGDGSGGEFVDVRTMLKGFAVGNSLLTYFVGEWLRLFKTNKKLTHKSIANFVLDAIERTFEDNVVKHVDESVGADSLDNL